MGEETRWVWLSCDALPCCHGSLEVRFSVPVKRKPLLLPSIDQSDVSTVSNVVMVSTVVMTTIT